MTYLYCSAACCCPLLSDKDGNGEIDVSELHTTMSELGNLLTEEEICAFIAIMDVDGNGVIGVGLSQDAGQSAYEPSG